MKVAGFFLFLLGSVQLEAQLKVILDTDPSFDPDDAGCMAMLHTLASEGMCDILAMINSTNHKESSLSISAINQFYNRPGIPVGDYKGYAEKVDAPENTYDGHLARSYPRPLETWSASLDGVALYREILSTADDASVTIVIIGTMHNFYGLLKSKGDQWSSLDGRELVAHKVKEVVTMGGNFIDDRGLDRTNWGGSEELCTYTDWSCIREERNRMCRYVIENCRAPFVASGWEVGCGDYYDAGYGNVMTGQGLKNLPEGHIIRQSYEYHFRFRGGDDNISRHSNDQCALHYAILGESDNYNLTAGGEINLSEKGVCLWTDTPDGVQGYIQKKRDKDLIAEEIEALMMGPVPQPDTTAPSAPVGLTVVSDDFDRVIWQKATDATQGHWVVGYEVFVDGRMISRVYGTQYPMVPEGKRLEVRAINSSGLNGPFTSIELK